MQQKNSLRWPLTILGIVGIVFSSAIIFSFIKESIRLSVGGWTGSELAPVIKDAGVVLKSEPTTSFESRVRSPLPVHLKIPVIHVDAAIEHVGLTVQGAMDVPKGPNEVAWFEPGARPGEKGSAVIAGHEGWRNGIPAVFDDLHTLQKGDKLYVEDEKGAITTFVVRELRTYGENQDASDVFSSNDGKSHLNLVTCQGIWNKTNKSYSNRLVVFTDKEAE